jgi:hypothetical protein
LKKPSAIDSAQKRIYGWFWTGGLVRILSVNECYLAYYCNALIRIIEPVMNRSMVVERFITATDKDQ